MIRTSAQLRSAFSTQPWMMAFVWMTFVLAWHRSVTGSEIVTNIAGYNLSLVEPALLLAVPALFERVSKFGIRLDVASILSFCIAVLIGLNVVRGIFSDSYAAIFSL